MVDSASSEITIYFRNNIDNWFFFSSQSYKNNCVFIYS